MSFPVSVTCRRLNQPHIGSMIFYRTFKLPFDVFIVNIIAQQIIIHPQTDIWRLRLTNGFFYHSAPCVINLYDPGKDIL